MLSELVSLELSETVLLSPSELVESLDVSELDVSDEVSELDVSELVTTELVVLGVLLVLFEPLPPK